MHDFHSAIAIISFIIIATGLISKKLKRMYLNEPFIAMAVGILCKPLFNSLDELTEWLHHGEVLEQVCRFTIGMALMATALRLPPFYLLKNIKLQSALLILVLASMWLISGTIIYLLFGLPFSLSLLIGAVITPTDPVVAISVVTGELAKKIMPRQLRHTISFESGANDGWALPFVMLPLLIYQNKDISKEWFLHALLWESFAAIILGLLIGYIAGFLMHAAHQKKLMETKTILAFSLGISFFILGFFELLKLNSIIGVFSAGVLLNHKISKNEDIQQERVQESIEWLFTIPVFFLLGLILPFNEWWELGWAGVLFVAGIFLLRRIPGIFIFYPLLKGLSFKEKLMLGWFAPIGVAAFFYALFSYGQTGLDKIWHLSSLIIFSSTVIHGLLSLPIAKYIFKKN